jgi:hypothetical protein
MKKLTVSLVLALTLGACSSAAVPGADKVLNQTDKANDVKTLVECQNQSQYGSGGGTSQASGACDTP